MSTKIHNTKICIKCKTKIRGRQCLNCCICKENFFRIFLVLKWPKKFLTSSKRTAQRKRLGNVPFVNYRQNQKIPQQHSWTNKTTLQITPNSISNVTNRSHKLNIPIENSFDSLSTDDDEDVRSSPTIQNKTGCPELRRSKSTGNLKYTMEESLQTTLNEFTRSLDNINDLEIIQEMRDEIK